MDKKIISFATDFGLSDGSVGVVKGVINRIDPELKVLDISHNINPQDIRGGSLLLMRAIQYLPKGVLLGVVDPGVGTDRKAIVLETEWGYMVGPDNGLLNLAAATVGGAIRAFELTNENWIIPSEGSTFEARDKFAPFAAALASGQIKIEEVGSKLELELLSNMLIPLTEVKDGVVKGLVLWNDHFGNSQTNITPSELNDIGVEKSEAVDLKIGDSSIVANWFNTYQELEENTPGIVTDSWGMISIVINNKSALDNLNTTEGTKIEIKLSNSTKNQ